MFEPLTEPNVPLLRKVVEWVEEQAALPEGKWDQIYWFYDPAQDQYSPEYQSVPHFCNTSMCVAGKVVWDAGWKPVRLVDGATDECQKDGETLFIEEVAAGLLGIDDDQAYQLFGGTNTAAKIRRVAEQIAGEKL